MSLTVHLNVEDKVSQDLLWVYAERIRHTDSALAGVIQEDLVTAGYNPSNGLLMRQIVHNFFGEVSQGAYVRALARVHQAIGSLESVVKYSKRFEQRVRCEGCGKDWADLPSKLCPGCQAYKEHQK